MISPRPSSRFAFRKSNPSRSPLSLVILFTESMASRHLGRRKCTTKGRIVLCVLQEHFISWRSLARVDVGARFPPCLLPAPRRSRLFQSPAFASFAIFLNVRNTVPSCV
uniref:Uncharacterized protein n=1 Tax=Steinernema glaseri TaxID=37863 RepID=A0A1I7YD92_9BILA